MARTTDPPRAANRGHRIGKPAALSALLGRIATSTISPDETPDERCPRCNALYPLTANGLALEVHACCRCRDLRRVLRYPDGLDQPGITEICPCEPDARPPADVQLALDGVPAIHLRASLDLIPEPPRFMVQGWATTWPPEPSTLLLVGGVGSGKTSAACAVIRAVFERYGHRGAFATGPGLLARLRATQNEEARTETEQAVMAYYCAVPLLVVDDLGKEKLTDWAEQQLWSLIDHRWAAEMATIVTGNAEDLKVLPDAIKSRISSGLRCAFPPRDRRIERGPNR